MSTRKNKSKTNKARTFKNTDYNSNDGMLTSIWGPPLWHVIHSMSFNYPVKPSNKDKKHYRDFILNLRWTLPCGKCRKNFICNFKKLPLKKEHMKSRETFSKYVYDLHENINKIFMPVVINCSVMTFKSLMILFRTSSLFMIPKIFFLKLRNSKIK